MAGPVPNYFTCTLGQATLFSSTHEKPYTQINEFLDHQAGSNPDLPAVGFYAPPAGNQSNDQTSSTWQTSVLTFRQVQHLTLHTANLLYTYLRDCPAKQTVALLCPSTPTFLFTWLGLMRLGHPVLLIAPQCAPSAIASLCEQCKVRVLFYDGTYADLTLKAIPQPSPTQEKPGQLLWPIKLSFENTSTVFDLVTRPPPSTNKQLSTPDVSPEDIAYLHHTSGTSTGIPKPIPQSHHAAIGVLPHLPPSNTQSDAASSAAAATFTTTPLYHGGIADLFRAWTSDSMIWLFPGGSVPITAANVIKCLEASSDCSDTRNETQIRYFSSVPYVLQLLTDTPAGLSWLKKMDLVGVGGAALPTSVGDRLASQGVRLISRFGSAECGFLLSSHRDFSSSPSREAWSYLRPDPTVLSHGLLHFEPQVDTSTEPSADDEPSQLLSELIVGPQWPHMAKRNRDDGSYATSDLFQRHPTLKNAWKYHSRADAQITLVTGKKFDPAPLENEVVARTRTHGTVLLNDVLIFGTGQPYPGMLLCRSDAAQAVSDDDLVKCAWTVVEDLNGESAPHARVGRAMLVPMPWLGTDKGLEKSSKGTVLRGRAEERFSRDIEMAYTGGTDIDGGPEVSDNDVAGEILRVVKSAVGVDAAEELGQDTDLFSAGVDSVACVQIRHRVARLLPHDKSDLPLTVVEDCGTVSKLAQLIVDIRHGKSLGMSDDEEQLELMRELVQKYSFSRDVSMEDGKGKNQEREKRTAPTTIGIDSGRISSPAPGNDHKPTDNHLCHSSEHGETILLTGATGSLGSHILHQLLTLPQNTTDPQARPIRKIILLLRGGSVHAARERVRKSLLSKNLVDIDNTPARHPTSNTDLEILPIKLHEPRLGLTDTDYRRISAEGTRIIHAAWSVNFLLSLKSFEGHLNGLRELLQLAVQSKMNFVFASSVASVANHGSATNPRKTNGAFVTTSPELVPEEVVDNPGVAGDIGYSRSKWVAEMICADAATRHHLQKISVLRVGQLSGDTRHGIWNASEGWPLMMSSVKIVRALPRFSNEVLSWLPVDVAARASIEVSQLLGKSRDPEMEISQHLGGQSHGPELGVYHIINPDTSRRWEDVLERLKTKTEFEIVSPRRWVKMLEDARVKGGGHPCFRLLGFWKKVYGGDGTSEDNAGDGTNNDNGSDGTGQNNAGNDMSQGNGGGGMIKDNAGNNTSQSDRGDGICKDKAGGTTSNDNSGTTNHTDGTTNNDNDSTKQRHCGYAMHQTLQAAPVLRSSGAMTDEYIDKLWRWIDLNIT